MPTSPSAWPASSTVSQSSSSSSSPSEFFTNTTNSCCPLAEVPIGNTYIVVWYLQIVYIVAFATMIVVAAGGNLIVIWIVLGHKRMRTVTNYFLVNLALADALITMLNTTVLSVYHLNNDWLFGRAYCKFAQFIGPCTITASVFTFMAIAVDRYIVIVHPLKPRIPAGCVRTIICGIWIISFAVSFPLLLYGETHTYSSTNRTVCYLDWPPHDESTDQTAANHINYNDTGATGLVRVLGDGDNEEDNSVREMSTVKLMYDKPANKTNRAPDNADFAYSMVLLMINYVIPLSALALTYARVGLEIWGGDMIGERTAAHDTSIKSKRKVVKMMIVIVIIFGVCWLPYHVWFIITNRYQHITKYTWSQHVYLVFYWLAMSNSMYNPIIYCWMNARYMERFRSGFKFALRWLPCVHWQANDAAGFWGYTSSYSRAATEQVRYTFAAPCGSPTGSDAMLRGQPVLNSPLVGDGARGTWVFQNRGSASSSLRRRLDSES